MRFGRQGLPAHAARGAAARQSGASFEGELEATHRAYRRAELAVIARAHPPVGGIPGQLYYAGKGDVDYVGHVRGIPVAFDAKSEAGAASYKHDAGELHQLDFLLDWRDRGGVAFLLLVDRPAGALYLVDDLLRLRQCASVPLRTHARGKSLSVPVVPALHRTESERALDAALGRPVWPWLDLARLHSPTLADALDAHSRPGAA